MTFTAYIERQKKLIRSRHVGEEYLVTRGDSMRLNSSEEILKDIDNLRGLNKRERLAKVEAV